MSIKEIDNVKINCITKETHMFHISTVTKKNKSLKILSNKKSKKHIRKRKFTKYYNSNHISTLTLPAHNIDINCMYIIFDYNGTLVNKATKKIRPYVCQLNLLKENGFKIGMWTNVQLKNIDLEKIQHECNVTFDLILHQNNCDQPTDDERKENPLLSDYDQMKNPLKFFDIKNIIIVDDTPYKIPYVARECVIPISTWLDDSEDCEIDEIVHKIICMYKK